MLRSLIFAAFLCSFLVLLHQNGVEAGRGKVKMEKRQGKARAKGGKAGKGGGSKDSSPFGRIIDMLCGTPPSPMNGGFSCQSNARQMKCEGKCASGFQFPDGSITMQLLCYPDGTWTPSNKFPDCEAVCNPPCQNGGTCLGSNKCLCDRKYWGTSCEIPISVCDITQIQSVVGYQCNRTNDVMTCTVNCPDGMEFEQKPASQYTCGPYASWQPPNIPGCQANNMIVHPVQHQSMLLKESVSSIRTGKNGMCATWGQKHFQTFDGSVYSVEGQCTYVLAKDCNSNSFAIHLKMDEKCTGAEACSPTIQIYMDNQRYDLKQKGGSPTMYRGTQEVQIPYAENFFVEKVSHYIIVTSSLGFSLIWDGKDGIQVEVTLAMQNKTCGLCGNYDGFGGNDLKMADGSITTDLLTFVNSWKMNGIGDVCHDPAYLHETCVSNSLEREAAGMCQRILDPEYAACAQAVDPTPYIQACKNELCACNKPNSDCGCRSVEAYFRECARFNGPLKTTWRKADFCPATCPQGMTFKDCGTTCAPTCANPQRECAEERCLDGCFCAEGTVRHGEECLPAENCPCTFIGQEYKAKETIQQDCNTCMCFGGHWQCTREKCEARCSSVGDPHYTTFDGKRYDFMGKCAYYLVAHTNFTIEQETVGCDGSLSKDMDLGMYVQDTSNQPSCTKWVTVRSHGTELQMKQNKVLLLNGKEVTALPTSAPGLYIYMASSTFIRAQLSNGIVVSWDGQARVYIDAPPSLMGETQGLCGTFTLSQRDDFLTREGDIEHNVNAFANKWKTEELCFDVSVDDAAQDPCTIYTQRKSQAVKLCSLLHSPVFQHCHDFVDPNPFYHNCMYDMCSCQNAAEECLCPILADYAAACTKIGVPINWREDVQECHVTCPSGQVYQTCSSSCQRSCFDIANNPNCREQCVEGCNCPQGFTLDVEGHCIPVSQCMCLFDNFLFEPGETEIRERQLCECSNAKWKCRPASEEELLAKLKENPAPSLCSDDDNMEPTDCELLCPPTCANMHNPPHCPTTLCKPGCRCKSGYVLETHSKKCVQPSHCPCHHGGRNYGEGEMMHEDCNTCVCSGGQWKCEKKSCAGTCTAWGDSHFKTFDNLPFEFLGDCEYTMAHGRITDKDYFTVNIQNKACGTGHVACFKAVSISLDGEKLILTKDQPLPRIEETKSFIVREVGLFVVVHTDIGLTVLWDKGTRVYIRLDTRWQDKVEGLCGNFNENELDDFRSPVGGPVVVRPAAFADSWKTHDQCSAARPVQDTCQLHPERQSWAQKRCSVLKSEIFSSCHAEIPFEPYLERCISDACACDTGGDCECLCTAIAAYAQECNIHGNPILWRSQDLCPIQCRTCDEYTSCMSVCPKKTCETEFLYGELSESCKQEMCVEGCEPPSCPLDEIFKDDLEFKCIPRSECVRQPCKVINGKMYHEGERVSDPDVVDSCQSCHCKNGALSCVGEACPASTVVPRHPTSPPPPIVVPQCVKSGWTDWVNSYIPTYKNGGDYERLSELITGPYDLCPLENIVAIECRTTGTLQHSQNTGQPLRCNLPEGLVCENVDQLTTNKLCYDYEIRVFCSCEGGETISIVTPTIPEYALPSPPPVRCTAPGWTTWMNSVSPTSKGEIETIASMRKKYTFCGASEIEKVQCREVSSRTVYSPEAFPEVECTKQRGAVCRYGKGKVKKCSDFEVRFYCSCKKSDCDYPRGMEDGAIRDDQITVSSSRLPNNDGKFARLRGPAAWSPKEIKPSEWIQIDLEEVQEITGIRTQGSPENAEWVSSYKLMYSDDGSEWTTLKAKGDKEVLLGNVDGSTLRENLFNPIEARFVRIIPIEWVNWISLRLEILGCNRLVAAITTAPPMTTPTITRTKAFPVTFETPTPFPAFCNFTGWSEWMDIDSPFSLETFEEESGKIGDNELLPYLRFSYSFCDDPSSIVCRVAGTNQFSHTTGQVVSCDVSRGLECVNSEQSNGACLNYEVSVYCECGETAPTTPSTTTTTPEKKQPPITCKTGTSGYTDWMNAVDPDGNSEGDKEIYNTLRNQYEFCEQKYISSMECRVAGERTPFDQAGQYGVVCDINHGLLCLHSMQPDGQCKDYEVRFYCLCLDEIVSTPPIPTKEGIKEFTAATYPRAETSEPPHPVCDEWTRWYDYDNPADLVEEERWSAIDNFTSICPLPTAYDCVDKDTSQSYSLLDLRLVESCNSEGIVCHSDQMQSCPDFKIRAFCACEPPTVPPVLVPPTNDKCDQWTEWFNIDHPSSGGGDFERIDELRKYYGFCKTEMIDDIQCETADNHQIGLEISDVDDQMFVEPPKSRDYQESGDKQVKCHRYTGLECYNILQEPGKICQDYRVRFYCNCEKVKPLLPMTTTTPPALVAQTCNAWTEWINLDTPYDGYEEELFSVLPNFNQICPIITEVECVEVYSELPYSHFPDIPLQEACTRRGIACAGDGDEECPDYKIRAYCECEGVTTTVATTTALPCDEGWTEWFDNDDPASDDGDFETMAHLRNKHKFCATDQITDVECKTTASDSSSWIDHSETGNEAIKCSKYVGLACYNNLQPKGKKCRDYSIRFYCSCGVTTTPVAVVPTAVPTATPPCQPGYEWDNCAYRCDQMCHSFLKLSVSRGECKNVESHQCVPGCRKAKCDAPNMWRDEWTCVPETECTCVTKEGKIMPAGDVDQTDPCERCQCLHNNLICLTDSGCRTTPTPYPQVTESTPAPTTKGPCEPGSEWDECAYRCDQMCHSFLKLSISRGQCENVESHQCIPGCRELLCDTPNMWLDEKTCVPETECTCVTKDGKIMPAGEVDQTDPCERCQCLHNNLICLADSGCRTTPTPYPQVTESTPATTQAPWVLPTTPAPPLIVPPVNIQQENCWTSWVNVDSPKTGFGDYESIAAIRAQYEFCSQPVLIQCREVTGQGNYDAVGQSGVKCDLFSGLVCQNQLNGKDGCFDYEVRFYCPCEETTTTPPTTPTPTTSVVTVIGQCHRGYTEWFNSHVPDAVGEYENIAGLRNHGYVFCANDEITVIECRDTTTGTDDSSLRSVVCNIEEGFHCRNSDQAKGKSCPDYEVRFLCECLERLLPEATTPVASLPSRPTPIAPTTIGLTEVLPPCAYWSRWINDDSSVSGTGDEELITAEQLSMQDGFCKEGEITEIECVDASTGVPHYETGDHGVTCAVHEGLVCRNEYQESGICRDYKIRYYCSCEPTTTTPAATTTTPPAPPITSTIFIVPSTAPPVLPCNEFVNLLESLPDSNLKATSSLTPKLGPQSARLNSKVKSTTGGSWTAGETNKKQYLQIDLGSVQPVYGIITKGSSVNQEWVKSYRVQYSRDGAVYSFVSNKGNGGIKTFSGNFDNVKTSRNMFDPAFEARFIRILPRTWERQISLRLELLGCAEMVTTTTGPTSTPALECVDPMGLENMELADQQITASSSRDEFHGPSRARLGTKESAAGSGGWLPKQSNKKQYLDIDFIEPKTLTAIVTQGRDGHDQWVTSYEVQFSNDGKVWNPVVDENNKVKTFAANIDNESPVTNTLEPSIRARYLRILPKTWNNFISLRLEVKGCYEPYPEITTPEGVKHFTVTEPTYEAYACLDEMGLENGQLSDDMIKVSSSKDGPLSDGSRIRLNTPEDEKSGGWVAETLNDEQFVEIDLRQLSNLTGITVQGRDKSDEWVTKFLVLYSTDGITWTNATNSAGEPIFTGNHDSSSPQISMFDDMIEAQRVVIVPLEWHKWISMRLELIGCFKPYPKVPGITTTPLPSTTIKAPECLDEMGLENGQISDDMIKVSSSKDGPLSDGSRIRLNTPEDEKSGGWVAETLNDEQFVEIDLRQLSKLTGITVQGRDKSDEWVTKFLVLYSTDGITWTNATNEAGDPQFTGNHDSSSPKTNMFEDMIEAQRVVIVPLDWHKWISMRLELIGCFKPYPKVPATTTTPRPPTTIKAVVCDEPMGLENGAISNSQITVSSTLAGIHSGGPQSRLNTKETASTGGWVAQVRNRKQYIQIDFLKPVNLTGIITQGRDKYREWVKTYTVTYSTDGNTWEDAYSEDHKKTFSGNEDEQTPVKHNFDKMLAARFIRVNPESWYNWISMRLEILGCYTGPETTPAITTTPFPATTTPTIAGQIRTTVAETCVEYGPWLNLGSPSVASEGDHEPIEDLIAKSHMCKHPIVIQCRDYITHEAFETTEQRVLCDLEQGLVCKHEDQKTKHCYDYEARIGCYTCPVNATLPPIPPVALCPEVPLELAKKCPRSCPRGQACDGAKCVSSHDCACYVEGKKYYPGDKVDRTDCHECTCQLEGHSHCAQKICAPCENGMKNVLTQNCSCTCERCPDGQTMCPSSGECVAKERWCDGIVDCPDDEVDCVIATTPSTTPSCPEVTVPACSPGTTLVLKDSSSPCPEYFCELLPTTTVQPPPPPPAICDLTGNFFKTFDGLEYPYEICHHLLVQDKQNKNFNVTIHKKCSEDSKCSKHLVINQDSHRIRLGPGQIAEYNSREYTPTQLVKLGQSITDFSLRIVGNSVIFVSTKYGFQVEVDISWNVRIEVDSGLLFKINGLCGLFSNDPADDMQKPNGAHASAVEEFGNSWATDSLELCEPQVCPPLMMKEAMDICNELRDSPFKKCNGALPPDYHVQVCLASMCECMINSNQTKHECACQAYLPYVEACQKLSPPVEVEEWRFKKGCVPKCPPGLEWHDCGPSCERTCDNLYEDLEKCQDQSCVSGCFCPPGLVKKGDRCLEKESCQDCVCKGYGDPHYYTFDSLYYPFQGNCTYILSRDRSPTGDHKYEVYATNEDCFEEPNTTCTVEIYVLYDEHIAHFKVNESVTFDGVQLFPPDFPFESFGFNITVTSPPGRTVTIRVDAVHLEVRYFELNYGFEVRIPSEVYYNKTEGLCANCDYDKSDDMLHKDGYLTNDTDDFAFSWLASAPEGMKDPSLNCVVKPEVPCESQVEKARCQKLLDEEFANCHLLVDPEPYLKACEFDTCHSVNPEASLCRSLTIYARECAQAGVCITDWRTDDFCPAPCPDGMHFDQCGPACMHTCNNKDRYKRVAEECQLETVEGCFCSGNRILRDGVCVDPIQCETCDIEDHKVGDTWNPNPCTTCTCNTEVKVQCTESLCPSRPVCPAGEWLQTIPADNNSCCETHLCIPTPPPTCPEEPIPSCLPGEIANPVPDENNCTKYTCVCDLTKCPPVQEPVTLEEGAEVVLNKSGCCPVKIVVCKPEKCPEKARCPAPMVETPYDTHRCCPQYDCKPPPDKCAYEHEFHVDENGIAHWVPDVENRKTELYKPGDSWLDGFCATCRCTGKRRGHYKTACQGFMCPEPPRTDDYHIETEAVPKQCCPKYHRVFCKEGNHNYTIGQQWHPHAFDVCRKLQCISTETGDAEKMEVLQSCQTKCKADEKYVKPPPDECCGHCEAVACLDQDNKVHEVGDEWRVKDTCLQEKCIDDPKEGIRELLSEVDCPPLPENCPEDKIKSSEDGCCEICMVVPEPELCYARQVNLTDTIRMFDKLHKGQLCTNRQPVHNLTECFGKCESHSSFSSHKQEFVASCHCCVPLDTKKRTVMLECEDASTIPLEFKQPTSCMCSPCSNNEVIKNDLKLPGARSR